MTLFTELFKCPQLLPPAISHFTYIYITNVCMK